MHMLVSKEKVAGYSLEISQPSFNPMLLMLTTFFIEINSFFWCFT